MKRRDFIKDVALSLAAVQLNGLLSFAAQGESPQVSITIDDFSISDVPYLSGKQRNQAMLQAFNEHSNLKAALFVTGKFVEGASSMSMLNEWDKAGHIICNHTYSHKYFSKVDFKEYTEDILKNEQLLKHFVHYKKLFRFPYLMEGNTKEQISNMRSFLHDNNYKTGYVSIDASDWYIDSRLKERLKKTPEANRSPYHDYFLKHILDRANYYNTLSNKVLGRSIKHTLLLHHSVLNGLFLSDLLNMFKEKGWKLIDAADAFSDPVYLREPDIIPAGQSLIWALAKETGKFEQELRYPGEDSVYEEANMDALGL